jgi:2-iminobutanoate/2-iminopropanoate deaminase
MDKKIIHTDHAPKAVGPYSQAVMVGNVLYCSGQIAINPVNNEVMKVGVKEQTHQVMQNIEAVLKQAGLNLSNIVKTTIFVTDMNDFATVNEVYASYLQTPYPARSTVGVAALPKGVNVEIEVVAIKF